MYYSNHSEKNTIYKYYSKKQKKQYIWRRKVHRNTNLSKIEKLPYDLLTYITQFLNITNITILPILSHSLYDDFKLNYFKNSRAELYLRFNYGYSILDNLFLFSKMDYNKDESLIKKCVNDKKLLNEFIIIINLIIKSLIKEQKFTEDKIIVFIKFMLELNNRSNKENKFIIVSNLINIIVKLNRFLERHLDFFITLIHKCLEFIEGETTHEKQLGINGMINLIQNSKSNIILENILCREIGTHMSQFYDNLSSDTLEFIINFYLDIKKRKENNKNKFRQKLIYYFESGTNF